MRRFVLLIALAPACVTGSCVDLSLGLYMAPGTIGACL